MSSGSKPDPDEYKCFVCKVININRNVIKYITILNYSIPKTGLNSNDKSASRNYFRGQNLYFHQSCASVMSRIGQNKEPSSSQQNIRQNRQIEQKI